MPSITGKPFAPQIGTYRFIAIDENGNVTDDVSTPVTKGTGGYSRTWVRTPGYRQGFAKPAKSLPRSLPMNPFTYSHEKTGYPTSSVTQKRTSPNGKSTLRIESGLTEIQTIGLPMSPPPSLSSQASSKMLSMLKNQKVNIGVAIGEGKQTIDLFLSTANKLANSAILLKKGAFAAAARALGAKPRRKGFSVTNSVAQNWLALQYGWLPLLGDLYGLAEFLAQQANPVPRTKAVTFARATDTYQSTQVGQDFDRIDAYRVEHTAKCVVYFSEPLGGTPSTALGLTNPFAVAWELVPWSFVVDWFLPIGTYLSNLDATNGLRFEKGCNTIFSRGVVTRTHSGKPSDTAGYHYDTIDNRVQVHEELRCERTVMLSFPANPIPSWKNPLSKIHIANAMSLLAQTFHH